MVAGVGIEMVSFWNQKYGVDILFYRNIWKLAGLALIGGVGGVVRYKNDPEILAMTNLVAAYQRNDIMEFEKILKVGAGRSDSCNCGQFAAALF